METSEQKFQLRSRESGWRAATEVDGFRRYRETRALLIEVAQYCFTKSPRLRAIEQIFVKRAIRADSRAKRDMNVGVPNWVHLHLLLNCRASVSDAVRKSGVSQKRPTKLGACLGMQL